MARAFQPRDGKGCNPAVSIWSRMRQSFWFLPALLCLGAVVLAEGLIVVDRRLEDADLGVLDFVITRVGESGSRDLLGAIAGSMLTVASTTFSITIAVLALSSSTYGPRLVRNFMADRGNQVVLGIFVATFLYSLMVLRSIRVPGADEGSYFVPHLAVNVAVLLAVLSIGVFVYFIHHISDSVQVATLAEQVRVDLLEAVERPYPETDGQEGGAAPVVSGGFEQPDTRGAILASHKTGYVEGIDLNGLLTLAQEHDLVISLQVRPGKHVITGANLGVVRPADRLSEDLRASALRAVRIGRARNPHQDPEFSALLLEEMAVRALSPSTNDPYTAINAIDNLASGLVALAERQCPSPYRRDREGQLRVIARSASLLDILVHFVDAMRHYAVDHPTVLHRTLEVLAQVGHSCPEAEVRQQMVVHADRLVEAFAAKSPQDHDLQKLTDHADRVRELLLIWPDHAQDKRR